MQADEKRSLPSIHLYLNIYVYDYDLHVVTTAAADSISGINAAAGAGTTINTYIVIIIHSSAKRLYLANFYSDWEVFQIIHIKCLYNSPKF